MTSSSSFHCGGGGYSRQGGTQPGQGTTHPDLDGGYPSQVQTGGGEYPRMGYFLARDWSPLARDGVPPCPDLDRGGTLARSRWGQGTPGWDTPTRDASHLGPERGYPGTGYPHLARDGVPSLSGPGPGMGNPPPPPPTKVRTTEGVLTTRQAVCLLRLPRGLSCNVMFPPNIY